jgi:Skp family chaperone for outer membrane proteins
MNYMKKSFLLFAVMLLAGTAAVNAQGGGGGNFQRRTVEERVQSVHQKMDSAFKLDKAKLTQVDSAFANYYRSTDKVREELMAGGGDRSTMRQQMQEKTQPFTDARDKELNALLGDENFKIWKEVIEPSMRRGGGGPPRQ